MNVITPSPAEWDSFVLSQPRGHVLQLSAWADLKSAYGWTADRVAVTDGNRIVGGAQILFKRLPFRLGTMAYLPMSDLPAPGSALEKAVDQMCKRHHAAFLKAEPGYFIDQPMPSFGSAYRLSPQTVQPPNTVVIDISGTEDAIMARMNQGTRRKIRQSLKNDILYTEASRDDVRKFTQIMQVTGSRNEFGVHEPAYYDLAYSLLIPQHGALILAEHEGDPLAGVFVCAVGKWAWYLYGASSSEKRNLMASYGVQWKAIEWARARGAVYYDMWGIPDEPEAKLEAEFETRSDGLWGVYGFKRGWGGMVTRSAGTWDRVYNPVIYQAYQWALKRRSHGND